jgi:serine/threonine-protein kinase
VCSVLDLGVADDVPYLVMEYLGGVPFSAALRRGWNRGDVPRELVARVLADAARGLHAAHELRGDDGALLGVIHRDVSPQNIVVERDGSVKVLDFGIAKARGKLAVTRVGELKGKLAYMAPEQLLLAPLDRRVDVWSLGVLLWEATIGQRLFHAEDKKHIAQAILQAPIQRPRDVRPDYPEPLERVVLGALERDPSKRTPTVAAFADALERWLYSTGEPYGAAQVSEWLGRHFGPPRDAAEVPTPSETSLPAGPPSRVTESMPERPGATPRVEGPTKMLLAPTSATSEPLPPLPRRRIAAPLVALVALPLLAVLAWAVWPAESPVPRRSPSFPSPSRVPVAAEERSESDPDLESESDPDPDPESESESDPDPDPESDPESETGEPTPGPRVRRERVGERPASVPAGNGSLNLLAIPQAVVSFRGRVIGRTPLLEHPLPPGRHTLALRPVAGGPEESVVVEIRPGEVTHRRVRLDGL